MMSYEPKLADPLDTVSTALPRLLQLKDSTVKITGLRPVLLGFLATVARVHVDLFQKVLVVTSGNDGQHSKGSKHFENAAVDLRSNDKTSDQQLVFLLVLAWLGNTRGVAVFDERTQAGGGHFHCELAG